MSDDSILCDNLAVADLPNAEIEISGEISAERFSFFRKKAIKKLGEKIRLDGFRPGHIPEKVLIERIGHKVILEEAAELALAEVYPAIVMQKKLHVIGSPSVTLTKLAENNPLGFKIKTATVPSFELPEYKTITKDIVQDDIKVEVTDKEVDDIIHEIQKTRAANNKQQGGATPLVDTAGNPLHSKTDDVPLTDDSVAQFGDFKSVADFKARIKENLQKEKQYREREKQRIKLSEQLVDKTNLSLPEVLITSELEKMKAQLKEDIARADITFEDYLKKIDKTEEDLLKEWRGVAIQRATLQLILNKIAEKEHIEAPENLVEEQVKHLMEHYKNANERNVRIYVETMLLNELVYGFLEEQKEKGAQNKEV